MTAISGRKCIGSWTSSGPLGCLERMLLGSSEWASTECFLTWRTAATPSGRLLFRLVPKMPLIAAKDYSSSGIETEQMGLWQTASVEDAGRQGSAGSKRGQQLVNQVVHEVGMWPTPSGQLHNDSEAPESFRARQAKLKEKGINGNGAGTPLPVVAKEQALAIGTTPSGSSAAAAQSLWPTPTGQDGSNDGGSSQFDRNTLPLNAMVKATGTTPCGSRAATGSGGGSLNPAFVEWMMGLPEGHVTGLGLSRTAELKMLGNGVVPQQAALAINLLTERGENAASA